MSKRFTDTEIWDKAWFMALKPVHKCLMKFLHDKCDNAGIWSPNWLLAATCIGEPVSIADLDALGSQIEPMSNGKVFIPSFIEFQYGELSEKCIPHLKVISLLKKHNLYERVYIPYIKGTITLKEEEEDKEEEKSRKGKGSGENPKKKLKDSDETTRQNELKAEYGKLLESTEGKDDREVFKIIREFVHTQKPTFAEPFVDAWNIFAPTNNISRVGQISQSRRDKIRIRTREPDFDFFKVLSSIRQNGFYRGESASGWKVDFNHVIESEDNYLKIIEKLSDN